MDKQTIEQLEGVAALDRRHHNTANKCLKLLWVVLAFIVLGFVSGFQSSQASAELHRIIAQQQATILKQVLIIEKNRS